MPEMAHRQRLQPSLRPWLRQPSDRRSIFWGGVFALIAREVAWLGWSNPRQSTPVARNSESMVMRGFGRGARRDTWRAIGRLYNMHRVTCYCPCCPSRLLDGHRWPSH
jgi:hypothetical protein